MDMGAVVTIVFLIEVLLYQRYAWPPHPWQCVPPKSVSVGKRRTGRHNHGKIDRYMIDIVRLDVRSMGKRKLLDLTHCQLESLP